MKENFCYSDIRYLEVPLPEDIEKLKWQGDFARAQRVLAQRLEQELPLALRKRLRLEQEILRRLPAHYPLTKDAVLEKIRAIEPIFTEEMLEHLVDENRIDWIYVNGERRFHALAASNYAKVERKHAPDEDSPLDALVERIKAEGGMGCHYRVRGELALSETAEQEGARIRVDLPLPVEGAQLQNVHLRKIALCFADGSFAGVCFDDEADAACRKLALIKRTADGAEVYADSAQTDAEMAKGTTEESSEREAVVDMPHLSKINGTRITIAPPDALQRTACIETQMQKGLRFAVEYSLDNVTPYRELDAAQVSDCQPSFFTEELKPHIVFTPYLRMLTEEVVGAEKNPLKKAQRIYDYITTHIRYSFMRAYAALGVITEYAAAGLKGDCGVQALLFITMCRIAGVPARWQSGQYGAPKDFGSHDWAQFYVAPYGWRYADCSFGGSAYRAGKEARRAFYFGNLDPYRIPMAAEFQQDFYVPTKHLRNDPYDNQVGEVFYEDRALHYKEFDMTYSVIEQQLFAINAR